MFLRFRGLVSRADMDLHLETHQVQVDASDSAFAGRFELNANASARSPRVRKGSLLGSNCKWGIN